MAIQKTIRRPHYLVASGAVQAAVGERRRPRTGLLIKFAAGLAAIWLAVAALDWGLAAF